MIEPVLDRIPAILPQGIREEWLDPDSGKWMEMKDILMPEDPGPLEFLKMNQERAREGPAKIKGGTP